MLEVYTFTVPGRPIGKDRPRFDTRAMRTYTPRKTKIYERKVQQAFRLENPEAHPLLGPVKVTIFAYFTIPKSWSKKKHSWAADGLIRPSTTPIDCDNIAKAVCDGLNGIAYKDDHQIVRLEVEKVYTEKEERAKVFVESVPDWEG